MPRKRLKSRLESQGDYQRRLKRVARREEQVKTEQTIESQQQQWRQHHRIKTKEDEGKFQSWWSRLFGRGK